MNNSPQENLPMCSICHSDPPINGIQLRCGHVFCYLCIKSVSETTGVCALCRAEIGDEFNFQEHDILGTIKLPTTNDGYYWFYEGYQGWWLYDADTNRDLEHAFQENDTLLERYVAGGVYIIDLINKNQRRKDDESGRARNIRRARLDELVVLGMGGLKGRKFEEILEMMRFSENQRTNQI